MYFLMMITVGGHFMSDCSVSPSSLSLVVDQSFAMDWFAVMRSDCLMMGMRSHCFWLVSDHFFVSNAVV